MNADIPETVGNLIGLAQKFQHENGQFFPFGEVLNRGKHTYQASDKEDAKEAFRVLDHAYREVAAEGFLEWAALCVDVRTTDAQLYPDGTDAIQVAYEEQDGQSTSYYVPYQERADGSIEYQPWFARDRAPCWFT